MIIEILKPHNTLIIAKYVISINGIIKYKAKTNFFPQYSKFKVYDLNKKLIFKIIDKGHRSGRLDHELIFPNHESFLFKSNSFIEHSLFINNTTLSFYAQKGHDVGIFIGNKQIGYFTRNKKYQIKGNKFILKLQDNLVDHRIIVGFILAYDIKKYEEDMDKMKLYDPGYVSIKPVKKIDRSWEPT